MSSQSWFGEGWELVVGVDQVTSSFLQLYRKGSMVGPIISANNRGVEIEGDINDDELKNLAKRLDERFRIAREEGNSYPNMHAEDIIPFAKAIGLDIGIEIRKILD